MDTRSAYDLWSAQYDSDPNKTRDLEATALEQMLKPLKFNSCLEAGCGTGKNTSYLAQRADRIVCVDFSEGMLAIAKSKIMPNPVSFIQGDLTTPWNFVVEKFDLVVFSLVLEHVCNLEQVLSYASQALNPGGYVYIGELHPFRQYLGSRARFETLHGSLSPACYIHHVSDYIRAATQNRLRMQTFKEFFEEELPYPRLLCLLLQKNPIGQQCHP